MKITVGGSFHGEGWTEVVKTADKIRKAGHTILAPGEEWTPINVEDKFVRFKGQEGMNSVDLQRSFFRGYSGCCCYFCGVLYAVGDSSSFL